jgi:hypothetical protein
MGAEREQHPPPPHDPAAVHARTHHIRRGHSAFLRSAGGAAAAVRRDAGSPSCFPGIRRALGRGPCGPGLCGQHDALVRTGSGRGVFHRVHRWQARGAAPPGRPVAVTRIGRAGHSDRSGRGSRERPPSRRTERPDGDPFGQSIARRRPGSSRQRSRRGGAQSTARPRFE